MKKTKKNWLAFGLALLLLAGAARPLRAQSSEPAQASPAAAGEVKSGEAVEAKSEGKEAKKEEAEDASKKFLQSPVVTALGKLVGLDPEKMSFTAIVVNFLILAALLFFGLRKALPAMFRDRTATIQKAMEEAHKASEDANRRLADVESRLANLGKEIEQVSAQAQQAIVHEEQRLQVAAEEDLKKIVAAAEQEIVAVGQAARRELTAHAADLSVALAQQKIHVDGGTDQELVRSFTGSLSGAAQALASSASNPNASGKDGQ